jgi:hypothetical protein
MATSDNPLANKIANENSPKIQQVSPQSITLGSIENNLLSTDSDSDQNTDEDKHSGLLSLNRNIKITSNKKKFLKLIKSSSSTTTATTSTNSLISLNSTSSNSNTNKQNNFLVKRKIFSTNRSTNESSSFSSTFKLNFSQQNHDPESKSTSSVTLINISSTSRSSSIESLPQENKTHIFSDNTSNSTSDIDDEMAEKNETEEMGLRNTRKAYECEDLGEAQAFQDDLFYLMDGLKSKYKLSERCLCALKLAEQCLSSEFRMSLRSLAGGDYVNKIFKILNDSNKFKSLALCTSLIMFALTQDKLKFTINKSTFHLIVSILNMKSPSSYNDGISFSSLFSNDPNLTNSSNSSIQSSKSTSPSQLSLVNLNVNHSVDIDYDENDDIVYKRIYDRCKNVFKQLISSTQQDDESENTNLEMKENEKNSADDEMEETHLKDSLDLTLTPKSTSYPKKDSFAFNSQLLALECILNLNLSKQDESLSVDWYKNELRELLVLEKLLIILKGLISQYQLEKQKEKKSNQYLLNKYAKYLNLLITVTQHPIALNAQPHPASANQDSIGDNKDCSSGSMSSDGSINAINESASFLNQNYIIEFQRDFIFELLNESISILYKELESISKTAKNTCGALNNQNNLKNSITTSIKQTFLVMINLTHKNQKGSIKFLSDKNLLDLIYKCIGSISYYFDESEQFDILIMSLVILLNIFDTNFKQESSLRLFKHVTALNKNSFEIMLTLYKKKEQLVHLAETDQEKELKELNSQIETQNVESINSTFMNSIGKAGKHMEDHIIAAHSALVIGYMILNNQHFKQKYAASGSKKNTNNKYLINLEKAKSDMKDNSFRHLAQIIRKFLVFMKIMKCSGFSDDGHIQLILKQLEEI